MADVRTYLESREKQLEAEIAKRRSEIAPLERELFEVKIARKAVGHRSSEPVQHPLFEQSDGDAIDEDAAKIWKQYKAMEAERVMSPYHRLTIKELVMKALTEQFPSGATAQQMLDLFSTAWGRGGIARTSLSPQLSRLKVDHKIENNGSVWFIRQIRPDEKAATDQ